jgi:hypothetical protein
MAAGSREYTPHWLVNPHLDPVQSCMVALETRSCYQNIPGWVGRVVSKHLLITFHIHTTAPRSQPNKHALCTCAWFAGTGRATRIGIAPSAPPLAPQVYGFYVYKEVKALTGWLCLPPGVSLCPGLTWVCGVAGPDQLFVSTESVDLSGPLADRDLVGNDTHGQAYFPIYIVIRPLAAGTAHRHTRGGPTFTERGHQGRLPALHISPVSCFFCGAFHAFDWCACLFACVLVSDVSEVGGVESEISSQVTMAHLRLSSTKAYSPKFVKQKIEVPYQQHTHGPTLMMMSSVTPLKRPM